MSNKKNFTLPKAVKVKPGRPSSVNQPPSSLRKPVKNPSKPPAVQRNATFIGAADTTMGGEAAWPEFDAEYRQMAYSKFLRGLLEECLVDEKIEKEESQLDLQIACLADRFQNTVDQLDKTSRRLKDISFVVEHKRLLDLKNSDSAQFFAMTDSSNAPELLSSLNRTEQASLDRLKAKNIDFGYNKETGHQQLLDAVNDAIDGLNEIKKHSNFDVDKFEESQSTIKLNERDRLDLTSLRTEFEEKYPNYIEKLLKEASKKISEFKDSDDD